MAILDRARISKDWSERGYSCDMWVDPPGQCWEGFVHSTDELVIALEGELEFEIDGEISRPAIGEEVYIPAGAIHSVRNIGESIAKWLYGYN